MKFCEITKKEYQKYWEKHPLKSFISSPKIASLREKSGWKVSFVGVKEDNKLIAASMLLKHKRHFNKYEFYSTRGYLLDFHNSDLVNFFTLELKKYIKNNNGYVLRIDPYLIYKERDIDGNVVEGGTNNEEVVKNLFSLGFKKKIEKEREQIGWMFSLDLEGKSEDEIMANMRQNTRNTIRKVEKMGITVDEISYDELPDFYKILQETGERKSFSTRNISYYQEMYKLFSKDDEVKFFIARLDIPKYISLLNDEKKDKLERLEKIKKEGQRKTIEEDISTIDKRIKEAKELKRNTNKNIIDLSGSMFILIKPEIVYLSSGNYIEYMKYNSQYLIQWHLIKYGLSHGFKKYNFYGIPDNINLHPDGYGIYEFKKGFNGYVEELIGEFELPITWHYKLIKFIKKIKR